MSDSNVVTPEAICCFAKLLKPAETLSGAMKYSCTLAFDKGEDMTAIKSAIEAAIVKNWGADKRTGRRRSRFRCGMVTRKRKILSSGQPSSSLMLQPQRTANLVW